MGTMAKRKDLKRRLKAASRRKQRGEGGGGVVGSSPQATAVTVDVVELVGEAILSFSESNTNVSDMVVLAALRSSQKGGSPSGEDALQLANAFEQIRQKDGVTARSFRNAINQMNSILSEHQDTKKPKAFLTYLRLFAS